jgi:hypothetical protein
MGHETSRPSAHELEQQPQFDPSMIERFGLGPEEANSVVSYGNYTGTLAAMLNDERCPVGNIVAEAYQQEGIVGVETKFAALSMMSNEFSVPISAKTRSYHEGTISRDELVVQDKSPGGPDFLV